MDKIDQKFSWQLIKEANVLTMRRILTIAIACMLSPCIAVSVQSTEQQGKKGKTAETLTRPQQPQPTEEEDETENLDFSSTGRPGQQTAGESRGACANVVQPIRAVLPESNSGKTVFGHPRFWVHFPELFTKKAEVEFIIQDESRKDIWRSRSPLNSATGYQGFALPKTENPLEIGQWYRWYVKVYCEQQVASLQYVQGWVKRIPLSSKLYLKLQEHPPQNHHLVYGNHRIWYDATDQLLNLYHCNPQSVALEKDWQNLIRAKGVQLDHLPSLGGSQISHEQMLHSPTPD